MRQVELLQFPFICSYQLIFSFRQFVIIKFVRLSTIGLWYNVERSSSVLHYVSCVLFMVFIKPPNHSTTKSAIFILILVPRNLFLNRVQFLLISNRIGNIPCCRYSRIDSVDGNWKCTGSVIN